MQENWLQIVEAILAGVAAGHAAALAGRSVEAASIDGLLTALGVFTAPAAPAAPAELAAQVGPSAS